MNKFKRIILTVLCVALFLSFGCFVIYRTRQHDADKAQVFGHSFGKSLGIYSNLYANYAHWIPNYCVTDNGVLYLPDYSGPEDGARRIGKLTTIQLNKRNFDDCIQGAHWIAYNMDAATIRTRAEFAWKCLGKDGELYYLILLDNGDVFLACGIEQESVCIYEILCLHDIGTEDVFFEKYPN